MTEIATVRTGSHSTAQGELIPKKRTRAGHMADVNAAFQSRVLSSIPPHLQTSALFVAEAMRVFQRQLEGEE